MKNLNVPGEFVHEAVQSHHLGPTHSVVQVGRGRIWRERVCKLFELKFIIFKLIKLERLKKKSEETL